MTIRDKIMDEYWLEFLDDEGHHVDSQEYHSVDGMFWKWFYSKRTKIEKKLPIKVTRLDDYLAP